VTEDPLQAWREQVIATADRLDRINYFQLLGVSKKVAPGALRTAFRSLATGYHPDRHSHAQNEEFTDALAAIYRRITEAYAVLRDPASRRAYDTGLQAGVMRFNPVWLRQGAPRASRPGSTDAGRRHFGAARQAAARGDLYSARNEIRTALLYEPDEAAFLALAKKFDGG
jgi:DnaJ-class molecular chaperone